MNGRLHGDIENLQAVKFSGDIESFLPDARRDEDLYHTRPEVLQRGLLVRLFHFATLDAGLTHKGRDGAMW